MAGESSKRRSVRQADTRKRSLYLDPETDDDFTVSDGEDDLSEAHEAAATSAPATKTAKPSAKRIGRPPQRETRSKAAKKAKVHHTAPKSSKHKSKHIPKPTKETVILPIIPSDGRIPSWDRLPYEILAQIFSYAFAAELETEAGVVAGRRSNHPNTWLLRTARKVCRTFAEPALTAFYQSPVLLASRWLEDLNALVKQPKDSLAFKYRMKVRRLVIASRHLELHQRSSNSMILPEMIARLPQLSELVITHPQDDPPFEMVGRSVKWKYPMELFDALDSTNIRLLEWRWNWHLVMDTVTGQPWHESSFGTFVNSIHLRPSFQSLRHLIISHLPSVPPFPELIEREEDPAGVVLANAICSLPELKSLAFETCDCLTDQLLQALPNNLERVKIVNCATLTSDMLYNFLSRDGSSDLLELHLHHNPFLEISFLASLRSLCPKLQVLKMDLFDHREPYWRHFGEPKYEQLLVQDEYPTWPSALRTIELVHLQKWGSDSAQNLFRSLVESAENLLDLRRIVLQAHINIAWRDRAAFRDQWIERLQRVYLRKDNEPDLKLASLKAWRSWTLSQQAKAPGPNDRVLSHVAITPRRPSTISTKEEEHNSDNEAHSKRRSKRISDHAELLTATPPQEPEPPQPKAKGPRKRGRRESDAISVVSGGEQSSESDWRNNPEKFIQGLCTIVDIRIDNQRPREEQLNESHFLDDEASGDEEWTEGAANEDDGYAW